MELKNIAKEIREILEKKERIYHYLLLKKNTFIL